MKNLIQIPVKILILLCLGMSIMLSGNAFADLKDLLNQEIAARKTADANLQNNITALQNVSPIHNLCGAA